MKTTKTPPPATTAGDPLEVKLVFDLKTCRTCTFFWPQKGAQPYGPYPAYDFLQNYPKEKKAPSKDAFSYPWVDAITADPGFPEPEVVDGCRKAPIMTIGINPNLTAFLMSERRLVVEAVSVEAVVTVEVAMRLMEGSARVLVQIRKREPAAGFEQPPQSNQRLLHVRDVVEGEHAPYDIEGARVGVPARRVEEGCLQPVLGAEFGDAPAGDLDHAGGGIGHQDAGNLIPELAAEQAGARAELEHPLAASQGQIAANGRGDLTGVPHLLRVIVPGVGAIAEVHAESMPPARTRAALPWSAPRGCPGPLGCENVPNVTVSQTNHGDLPSVSPVQGVACGGSAEMAGVLCSLRGRAAA